MINALFDLICARTSKFRSIVVALNHFLYAFIASSVCVAQVYSVNVPLLLVYQ